MELLLHVFALSPCETNSRLQHSNSTRGGASRDAKKVGHLPLPVKDAIVQPMEKGFTTQERHDLAALHARLEQRLFSDLRSEALFWGFTFSRENPVVSLVHKIWMLDFHVGSAFDYLRIVKLEHCAYGGFFGKSTHHFTNLGVQWWSPKGLTGNGRCGRDGTQQGQSGVACQYGYVKAQAETGKWNHL